MLSISGSARHHQANTSNLSAGNR